MRLSEPEFWYRDDGGWRALALSPLSCLYAAGRALHARHKEPFRPCVPVLCLGNLVAGGGGKTPAAIAVMKILKEAAPLETPFFLSRGYGGSMPGPEVVSSAHMAEQTGDEPLLLARHAPTIIARDRAAGGRLAEDAGASLIVLDDGFQNPSLHKDCSLLVIDGASGFGNRRLLPAGPLREPLGAGLSRADAFIVIGQDRTGVRALLPAGKPVFEAALIAKTDALDPKAAYVAFAGIARPQKFRSTLEGAGVRLLSWHPFPDHHPYTPRDVAALSAAAHKAGAKLVTTEKDAVRLRGLLPESTYDILPVTLRFQDEKAVMDYLKKFLKNADI